jgi:uncharacterized NAD-dependent epimerase/dehydratase family protein
MSEQSPFDPGQPPQMEGEEPIVLMHGRPVRLSEALREYARPLLELATSEEEAERAMAVAIICWNAADLSEEQQQEFLRRLEAQGALPPDVLADFTREFERMKARKRELFG